MATFRVGVGSFNINDGSVGIGTEGSTWKFKVEGTIKSTNLMFLEYLHLLDTQVFCE